MSVAVGTRIKHIAAPGDTYGPWLSDGDLGTVIEDDEFANMFEAKDEFVVKMDTDSSEGWYFSEAKEGITWKRVEA